MKKKTEKSKIDQLTEGIIFTYTKRCPYLTESDIDNLRRTIEGYLKEGIRYDPSFIEWQSSLEWA